MTQKYDIIIYGATGFTGSLVFEYFAKNVDQSTIKWAIAGRNKTKLQQLADKIAPNTPILINELNDPISIAQMCESTKVLMNLVGPYYRFGLPIIKACIDAKTHYIDITGEPSFIKQSIDQFHEKAKQAGVSIVHCCGFDSIPTDLGTYFTLHQFPQSSEFWTPGAKVHVNGYVSASGSPSAGTWQTLMESLTRHFRIFGKKEKTVKTTRATKKTTQKRPGIHYVKQLNSWAVPFPTSDPLIVRRSAELLDYYKGAEFVYGNYFLVSSFWKVVLLMIPMLLVLLLIQFDWGVRFLLRLGPKPRGGPSKEKRKKSWFKVTFIGTATTQAGKHEVITYVKGGDPGYGETSKMASESAICLLKDVLPSKQVTGGVLTPASCFGELLINRLKKAGIEFGLETSSKSLDQPGKAKIA